MKQNKDKEQISPSNMFDYDSAPDCNDVVQYSILK